MSSYDFRAIFLDTIKQEAYSLIGYNPNLSDLDTIINLILTLKGKLVLTGVGKSGLIAKKIAATLSSTGTPSIFLHPTEAMHGDLGMLKKEDCIFAISYSGESNEIASILPHIKEMGIPIITASKSRESQISLLGDYYIPILINKEACPIQTAPTTSTTLTLAIGDALAVCLMYARNFTKKDFAMFHPGGSLGRELFVKVSDIMQTTQIPTLLITATLKEAIVVMTQGMLGSAFFINENNKLLGVLSDGDLRRAMFNDGLCLDSLAFEYATKSPTYLDSDATLAFEALKIMKDKKIQVLPIVTSAQILRGVLHLHTLIQAGFK